MTNRDVSRDINITRENSNLSRDTNINREKDINISRDRDINISRNRDININRDRDINFSRDRDINISRERDVNSNRDRVDNNIAREIKIQREYKATRNSHAHAVQRCIFGRGGGGKGVISHSPQNLRGGKKG